MEFARPLPEYLVRRYHGWKTTTYAENESWYRRLAEGQHPRAMVIACCDSRVHVTALFDADAGELFLHRNIANLVPPYLPDGTKRGTSAAIEYAVTVLKVAHIIIVGHSGCGGVKGCYDMCCGDAPQMEVKESFLGRWLDILRRGYDRLPDGDRDMRVAVLEKEAVRVSLENLITFPFVADAVKAGELTLHGLWHDIGPGELLMVQPDGQFSAI